MIRFHHARPASTLIELLIFMAILGIVLTVTMPFLFSATENRILQQTISVVEQNGAQVLGNVTQHVRAGERIISPAMGQTGSVLVLQTASGATDPTIIGVSSGSVTIISHLTQDTVSTSQVGITHFVVRNTSTSATRQSVEFSFTVSRTIRLQQPHSYTRSYETTVDLLPADVTYGNACGCLAPTCAAGNAYTWEVCQSSTCYEVQTTLQCP